jgi:hypothetical protein
MYIFTYLNIYVFNPRAKSLSSNALCSDHTLSFLSGIVGGGVQLGPLGTAATNRPLVPARSGYDDGEIGGMMIDKGN